MRSRPALALKSALAGVLCVAAAAVGAQAAAASPDEAQARELRAWLLRIHDAASRHNFQGTFVVTGNGTASSARIAHFREGQNQYERSEALDGEARQVYRHNDVVTTVWPATRMAMVEQRDLIAQFPALLSAGGDHIAEFYGVQPQNDERVAGHEANVLVVKPRDAHRYGYRLWSDRASGLLLRADVIGDRGEVLESSAFSDVAIGVRSQPASVLQPMKRLDGYRLLRPAMTPTRLEAEGWSWRDTVPGFRQVSCVRRPVAGAVAAAGPAPSGGAQMLQAIFSDGLTYVSLFIEPYDPQRHTHSLAAAVGTTQTLMQQQGDAWITVVGDVPPTTLKLFVKGLERGKK